MSERLTPRPISPQISSRIYRVFVNSMGDADRQYRNVRDIVKREVFDFNTRYDETPSEEENAFIDEVTLTTCFNLYERLA